MTERYNSFRDAYESMYEGYGDAKYSPDKLQKELPKGYSYGDEKAGKGDHKTRTVKYDGVDTDMKIGGAHGGRDKYSPSWGDGHRGVKKQAEKLDDLLTDIRSDKPQGKSDQQKRMDKAITTRGKKALSDVTGVGRKTNVQGKGNKAMRRFASMGEAYESMYEGQQPLHVGRMLAQASNKDMQAATEKDPAKRDKMVDQARAIRTEVDLDSMKKQQAKKKEGIRKKYHEETEHDKEVAKHREAAKKKTTMPAGDVGHDIHKRAVAQYNKQNPSMKVSEELENVEEEMGGNLAKLGPREKGRKDKGKKKPQAIRAANDRKKAFFADLRAKGILGDKK